MSNILSHIGLAITLFYIQNWIGSRSYSRGYIRFSLLDDKNEALSLNFVIKVFGPIVFLILSVTVFQYFGYNDLNVDIINVIYYYLIIRILFILIFERMFIVNWIRIAIHYLSIILVSTVVYKDFINSVENLLPNFSEIKNEIWLLIILFIYQIGNGIQEKSFENSLYEPEQAFLPELKNRKRKYIIRNFKKLKNEYDDTLSRISNGDKSFNLIIYSILIFEDFNRPYIIRFIERVWVRISGKSVTQGIMQVSSKKVLSDLKSVEIGSLNLWNKYQLFLQEEYPYNIFKRIIKRHCPDKKYVRQILFISKALIDDQKDHNDHIELCGDIKNEFDLYDYDE